MPADSPNDSAGTPITLGATVKLVGVVTSLNLFDNRFNDVEVTISHPMSSVVFSGPPLGETVHNTGISTRIKVNAPPAVLTVGA